MGYDLLDKVRQFLPRNKQEQKEAEAEDLRLAEQYRELINDPKYIELLANPLSRIRKKKITDMIAMQCTTTEEYGTKFLEFRTDIKRLNSLLDAPEKFFKAAREINQRREKEKEEGED